MTVVGQSPGEGQTTDVWALGNYAYVGTFSSPFCSSKQTGVKIFDISDPTNPTLAAFIKDKQGTRTNDVKAASLNTSRWAGDILVTTNQSCEVPHHNGPNAATDVEGTRRGKPPVGRGGLNIWDITNPTKPHALKQNFLSKANGIHNTFIWEDGGNAYLLAVDEEAVRDVIIVDITKPQSPKVITQVGAPDWPGLNFSEIEGPDVFLHDVWVQDGLAYLSYWDAGLVLLDVSDPTNPVFLGDSTYPNPDKSGLPPEGNGHVAVPTADGDLVILGDGDTSPFSNFMDSTIGSNKSGVALFGPQPAADVFPTPGDVVFAATNFGCNTGDFTTAPGGPEDIALIQRGNCAFSTKAFNAQAAGYDAYIVYNDAARGDSLTNMAAGTADVITIPGLFVGHTVGSAMVAAIGSGVTVTSVAAIADGEGFMRVVDVTDPANMVQVGSFAPEFTLPPENQNVAGTRSAHTAVVRVDRAYWAWSYNGIRVVEFSDCDAGDGFELCTPTEVAHFGGGDFGANPPVNNFWGVYLHDHPNGNTYILASDVNTGLYIFENP